MPESGSRAFFVVNLLMLQLRIFFVANVALMHFFVVNVVITRFLGKNFVSSSVSWEVNAYRRS